MRDMDESRLHDKSIDKVCSRCNGSGLRPIPGMQLGELRSSDLAP